jgi:hypothetical protein
MRLDRWTVLLPTQTSASQAGILHGNNAFIPAFRWWDRTSGRLRVSNVPADAADIVRRASNGQGLLSVDGASIGNLCSGDAVRAYLTMSTLRDPAQGFGHSTSYFSFFLSPNNFARMVVISLGEVVKELYQAWRQRRTRTYPTMHRGGPYPFLRAVTNVVLRQISTSLVVEEMFRGTPVIYVDLTDYDEIAHHSGPERPEALDALDGVDSVLGTIELAATDAPRPYRFVILSDHGQSLGATFRQRYGVTLEAVISELMGGAEAIVAATSRVEEWAAVNAFLSEASKTSGASGAMARTALRNRQPDGKGGRPDVVRERDPAAPLPELVVCASGNLGLIYFARSSERLSLEAIDDAYPGLVDALANHPGVGLIMVRTQDRGTIVVGRGGLRHLADDHVEGDDPTRPFGVHAVTGLRRVDAMVDCGDLVVISRLDPGLDGVAAFEELIGSHGGLGGAQTEGFILHPADWAIDQPLVGAESVYRQLRRWLADLGIDLGARRAA